MNVPFSTLSRLHAELRADMQAAFSRVYEQGWFIQGEECAAFDREFAAWNDAAYAVGVANGLDAIYLSLRALNIGAGDAVLVPSNTFIATALAVSYAGARVVLVDPDPVTYNMCIDGLADALTPATKAVIPVHLYGQAAEMDEILNFSKQHNLAVIEDCAQAHGATYKGRKVGTFGDIGCFSFYPGKNLGALGDGGAIVTDNKDLADRVRLLGGYGSLQKYHHTHRGTNSRLDELQAAFLRVKLLHLHAMNTERNQIARQYLQGIRHPKITLPAIGPGRTHIWHIFAVLCPERDALQHHLAQNGIGTVIHYPVSIADQPAYAAEQLPRLPLGQAIAAQELSLPLFNGMTQAEIQYVIDAVNRFSC